MVQVFRSTVADLILYEPLEDPQWRNPDEAIPSTRQMIEQIIAYQKKWAVLETKMDADHIKVVREKFRRKYCDTNTDPLESESKRERKDRETNNLMEMLGFFDDIVTKEQEQRNEESESESQMECIGLLEKSMIKMAHKISAKGINTKCDLTKPGEFSHNLRFRTYRGERYQYQQPDDMTHAVDLVLDRYNSLFTDSIRKTDEVEKLKGIFKSLAWFLFETLDLHPFGNGNGRLCRGLCCYVLSRHMPFPSPIYYACNENNNDHSKCQKPCKDCYLQALVDAGKSETRHPCKLATLIIESCWRTWREFMEEVDNI
jgi:hypothetical protein